MTTQNSLEQEIRCALNRASRENESNTPDFILAEYLVACLEAFEKSTNDRRKWYGHDDEWNRLG